MKINVGSKNQVKVLAVRDAVELYPGLFPDPMVIGVDIIVPEFGHPKNIDETVRGAIERAKNAFADCDYSFGLEGGLLEVPFSTTGFMEVGICAIYDGKKIYYSLGEYPGL